ncbi:MULTISPECIES: GNAT family N-acetyltransferase [unclassified Flavobacterium]|uniref:GNAT family N-acetyltransferase n=1 Tax=unclassified Flavobacterium TaxID=196869 RepID=UPI003F914DB3
MGKFKQIEATLKDGRKVTIREALVDDAANFLECLKEYIPQSEFIPKLEHEINLSIKDKGDLINSYSEISNSILLVAEFNNQIIGNIDLTGSSRKVMEHTAVIGMGMKREWKNTGLGTALLTAAIDWAKENSILQMLWLQVYNENNLALGLYKKMGFEESGTIKNFFKHGERYFDNVTMTLKV